MGRFLLLTHFLLSISASLTVLRPRPPPGSEQSVPREVQDGAHRLPQGLWTSWWMRASEWIHTWTVMSVNIFLSDSSSLVLLLFFIFCSLTFFFSIYYFPSTLVVVKALHQDTVLLPVVLLMHMAGMISIYQALIDSLAFGWLTAHHFGWCSSWTWLSLNNLSCFFGFFFSRSFTDATQCLVEWMFCFFFSFFFFYDIIVWGESRGQVEENLEGQQEQVRL